MWVDSSRLYPGQETQYYSELDNSGRYRSYKDSSGDQGEESGASQHCNDGVYFQVMWTPVMTTTYHSPTPITTPLTTTIIGLETTRGSSSEATLNLNTRLHCDLPQPSDKSKYYLLTI